MKLTWCAMMMGLLSMPLLSPDGGGGGGGGEGDGGAGGDGGEKGGAAKKDGGAGTGATDQRLADAERRLSALQEENKTYKDAIRSLTGSGASVDDLKRTVSSLSEKVAGFEARDAREKALSDEVTAAEKRGMTVDVSKARTYLNRVGGSDAVAAAREAVELFGSEKKAGDPNGGDAKDEKKGDEKKPANLGMKGTPPANGGSEKKATTGSDLARLYKEDPEAYKAAVAERRKNNPFFSGV